MPKGILHKSTLLLDLDDTTFVALSETEFASYGTCIDCIKQYKKISPCHTLSASLKYSGYHIFIINPEKLKAMIETIYQQSNLIIIFTAGLWLSPILSIISLLCNLSPDTSRQFNQSTILNPQHDSEKLCFSQETMRQLLKGYRLHGLFRTMPELRSTHFVLLDNDPNQIASCKNCLYVDGVRATTDVEDTQFYDLVIQKMQNTSINLLNLSPSGVSYYYPEEILKAYIKISEEEQPVNTNSSIAVVC